MPSLASPPTEKGALSDSEELVAESTSTSVQLDGSPRSTSQTREASEERAVAGRLGNGKRKLSPIASTSTAITTVVTANTSSTTLNTSSTGHQMNYNAVPARGRLPRDPMICAAAPQLVPPLTSVPLPTSTFEFFQTRAHPINQRGYRYVPCGPSPHSHLPTPIQRVIESAPQRARWSWEDRSTFVMITEDAMTVTAEKGWRAARANVSLREGSWYWEFKVHRGGGPKEVDAAGAKEGSWVRLGVGRREAPLNAPVGFDGHSYAYRDKGGEAITLARPAPYGKPFSSGSTIGVYLSLPPQPAPPETDRSHPSHLVRKRVPIRYKGSLYFELLEYAASKEMSQLAADPAHLKQQGPLEEERRKVAPGKRAPLPNESDEPLLREVPVLPGAKLAFWVDGECQGVAFEDLFDYVPLPTHDGLRVPTNRKSDPRLNNHDDGTLGYFPFASVFGGAIVEINPGPEFEYPPPEDLEEVLRKSSKPPQSAGGMEEGTKKWRPLCDRYPEWLREQAWLDDQDEMEQVRQFQQQIAARIEETGHQQQRQEEAGPVKKSKPTTSVAATVPKAEEVKKESPEVESEVQAEVGEAEVGEAAIDKPRIGEAVEGMEMDTA
ncbi:BZ3500_MvSof-1268-A1-R1_Chr2-1g04347 [Microbotryum saponariae]|uniref:BZ3500_MvSof-1268-A1-R1_Chr2-1g04347 protein n=1 Tax=Microbotryum saponariae TaxID=289078 RepID=A0A2X0KQD4_9BASI|nr:BZ3500_MvSof-1268-A1-R1_Chr2-1g04347 [Microbotryum saponariae]SCZ91503.1 BZ3501_MvSof-1269-A2-R1_Chr2-1g04003 [Microbotryum saponariae]